MKKTVRMAMAGALTLAAAGVMRPVLFPGDRTGSICWGQNEKLSGELAKAIRAGDLEAVKEALAHGADINALDERKMPPIGAAALLGKVDIVDFLAEKGADVNKNDGYGYTPLMCAAQRGQSGAVRSLLKHGADPMAKGANNMTAVSLARPQGPADPLLDGKTACLALLAEALKQKAQNLRNAANGAAPAAPAPAAPAPAAPPAANVTAPTPMPAPVTPTPPAAPPAADAPAAAVAPLAVRPAGAMQVVEQSPLVTKDADGTLGVGGADGKPIDGIKLSVHDQNTSSPAITVAPDGSIHVVYNETHGPPYQTAVYHRSSVDGGKTWTEPKNLSEDLIDTNVGKCLVLADPKNRVYVVWRAGLGKNFQAPTTATGGVCNLWFRVLEGGKWSKAKLVHPAGSTEKQDDGAFSFYAALNPAGGVDVVWNTQPEKWKDDLVDIRPPYRFQYPGVGAGLVFQASLDGANVSPPREALLTPVTGDKKTSTQPSCDGLDTMNGFIDGHGKPLFIARAMSVVDQSKHNAYVYEIFENGKPGASLTFPDLSFHGWDDIPTLMTDAKGKRHVVSLWLAGEHPSVRDFAVGSDEEPTIIRQTVGPKGTLQSMQANQGPNGRMIVTMQMSDTGERGDTDDFVTVSQGDGKWSPPVNVTNNRFRRSFAAKQVNVVTNVAITKTCDAGPAAAAIDKDGHLLLLMIQNEISVFGSQQGLVYYGGSSSKPTLQFLRF